MSVKDVKVRLQIENKNCIHVFVHIGRRNRSRKSTKAMSPLEYLQCTPQLKQFIPRE